MFLKVIQNINKMILFHFDIEKKIQFTYNISLKTDFQIFET